MNIGWHIVEQEEAEKAAAARPATPNGSLRAQLADVERQIAEVTARLDQDPGDDPALWPLRKKLVGLWRKHRELLNEIQAGTRRLTKDEALARMSEKGRRAVMGTLAPDGKGFIEKR